MNKLILLSLLTLGAAAPTLARSAAPTPGPVNARPGDTLIILDASGSMNERIRGETKMVIARRAVRELVGSLPDHTRLGLVVYSHRRNSCDDIELLIPPGPLDKPAFIAAVDALRPNGRTPVAASLEFAALALDYTKNKASIILVSDGEETCGGDPCATARKLTEKAAGLTIHAVAFDLSAREARAFACVASTTKGRFLQANDAATLKDALVVAVTESTVAVKDGPPAEDLRAATINVPAAVEAGADFAATWAGPDNPGDYLCIVPAGAPDDAYQNTTYTRQGSPLTMTALLDAGRAEVRYIAGRSRRILGRAALTITPVGITLESVAESVAGSPLEIGWIGPNRRGDYVTIVPKSAPDTASGPYLETAKGSPVKATTPIDPGEAEIRYISGQGRKVLARRPLTITAAGVTLDAPAEALPGSVVDVAWTGPNHENDFLVIVPKGAADGAWKRTSHTRGGSPAKVTAPIEPGEAEIRYLSGTGHKVLARRPIKLAAAAITLEAPAQAVAGSVVDVTWTGPNLNNDFLVIVPRAAADGAWKRTTYTRNGSPARVAVPIEPGASEIRYLSGEGHKVLARRPLDVVAAEITLQAPDEVIAGSSVAVQWTGPNHSNDFMAIVPQSAPDGSWRTTGYTRNGSPLKLVAPSAPGPGEIRYYSGTGHKVLARRAVLVKAAEIKLTAPASAPAGSAVSIEWIGPNHPNDYLTIVPKGTKDGVTGKLTYTRSGSPAKVVAPAAAGPVEIRYMNGSDHRVLARAGFTLAAP